MISCPALNVKVSLDTDVQVAPSVQVISSEKKCLL